MSSRLRLTLIFAFTVVVLLSVFSVYIYYSTVYIRKNAFYDRLWERADLLLERMNGLNLSHDNTIPHNIHEGLWSPLPDEGIALLFEAGYATVLKGHTSTFDELFEIIRNQPKGQSFEIRIGWMQYVVRQAIQNDDSVAYIIMTANDRNGQRLLHKLRMSLFTAMAVFIFIVFFVGWFFSGAAFKPIVRIIEAAEQIGHKNLNIRVDMPKEKGELTRLTSTINNSLDRLQIAFDIQKSFVASASHELRNPLTALQGNLEIALLHKRTDAEYIQFISSAIDDAKRLTILVNNLLLLSQTSSNEDFSGLLPVRIDELLLDVLNEMMKRYPARLVDFAFREIPQDEKSLLFPGNRQLLHVAFSNLIDNAFKYSAHDKIVRIETNISDTISVMISDEGSGIPWKDINHVFEPFFRSKRHSGVSGHGIGLTLARQIIELHKGNIQLKSAVNKGTQAIVNIPSVF
jgi:signal transduction histidine kinase